MGQSGIYEEELQLLDTMTVRGVKWLTRKLGPKEKKKKKGQVHVDVGVWLWTDGHKPISVKELDRERVCPESVSTEGPRNAKLYRIWVWRSEEDRQREMARSAIQRLAPYLVGRIRENQRLLSSVSSSSVLDEFPTSSTSSSSSPSPSLDALQLTENCVRVLSLALFLFLCYFVKFDLVLFSFIENFLFQFSVLLYWLFQFWILVRLICFMGY
jgi:hypothetical protein